MRNTPLAELDVQQTAQTVAPRIDDHHIKGKFVLMIQYLSLTLTTFCNR